MIKTIGSRKWAFLAIALMMLSLNWSVVAQDSVDRFDVRVNPIVVELFTSQGCSSCPPADRYLLKLRENSDLLPLSLHVDYWNYIGWEDPYSNALFAQRQQDYASALMKPFVYTPQIIIDGKFVSDSTKDTHVKKCIKDTEKHKKLAPKFEETAVGVHLPDYPGGQADIWEILFDYEKSTDITHGENKGAQIRNANVVRSIRKIGVWNGQSRFVKWPEQTHYGTLFLLHTAHENGLGSVIMSIARLDRNLQNSQ